MRYSDYATITGNTITDNNEEGIYLWYSDYATITGNTITNNNEDGIDLYYSSFAAIIGNIFINDGLYISSVYSSLTVEDNFVNGKPLGYFVNAFNVVIDQLDYYGQLILINCSHLTIANQNLSYTDIGLFGRYCNYLNIT
ncbi:MAG: right-handed parallel beta-helix repeat-containing protein [Candidatus Heimdallarchaeaceae archaeon]